MILKTLSTWGLLTLAVVFSSTLTGCSNKSSPAAPRTPYYEAKVTRENYISGRTFCAKYNSINGAEYGKYVTVPKDYSDSSKGNLQIYVYSKRAFNPALETVVLLDGGPGQNTHGIPPMLRGEVNELQFDQRGLGCSAPDTYDQYSDFSQYSTDNTIRDLEEIRKAYGISKITVYGVSYGTVPATRYAALFKNSVKSVVIEGVVGSTSQLHNPRYKAEKFNLVLEQLNSNQRAKFSDLMFSDDLREEGTLVFKAMHELLYSDEGFATMVKVLNRVIDTSGNLNQEAIARLRAADDEEKNEYPTAQRPMGVDLNILNTIYCKELGMRNQTEELTYNRVDGWTTRSMTWDEQAKNKKDCNEVGAGADQEKPYVLSENKVDAPVYYFQGSHDGATLAAGAIEHWKTVPQGKAYFMLSKRGGHNPNLMRIYANKSTRAQQQDVFLKAILADEISDEDVRPVNTAQSTELSWVLYVGGFVSEVMSHLAGI